MVIVLEGLVMCFILLIICVIGIANGPVGMVVFYEKRCSKSGRGIRTHHKGKN